jgi:hypothetical protein
MVEERVFIFDDLDNKKFYKLSYRGMIAMIFAAEQLGIWYRVSEIVNDKGVERFMKVNGETIEMYDSNENLLASSNV